MKATKLSKEGVKILSPHPPNKKSLLVCNMDHKLPSYITRLALTHFIMYVARNEAKMNNYCSREEKYTNLECFKSVMKYEDNKLSISFFF